MIKRALVIVWVLFSAGAFACEVIDDAGKQVTLKQPARRIISLAPDLTEILFAAGAGGQVVGVMQGSDFPVEAKNIPVVASFNNVDSEKILALHPDLIVVWSEGSLAEQLKKLNIPVFHSHQKKITDIPGTLRRMGCLAGTQKIAEQAAREFEQRYSELRKKYSHKKTISVFYEIWSQPLITISKESWINDVIVLCGGKNIFAGLKGAAPVVNLESVVVADPEVIIWVKSRQDWKKSWEKWRQVKAVKRNNFVTVEPDWIERAGPRILFGAKRVCEALALIRGIDSE